MSGFLQLSKTGRVHLGHRRDLTYQCLAVGVPGAHRQAVVCLIHPVVVHTVNEMSDKESRIAPYLPDMLEPELIRVDADEAPNR